MKLIANIENQQYEINIKREESKVFAEIDNRKYELKASQPEPNIYLLKLSGKIFEVYVSTDENVDLPLNVRVNTENVDIKIVDPRILRGAGGGSGTSEGIVEIKTAMPGKIVRVLQKEGTEVSSGEGVIVVEAMKMQNEIKSPKDGLIKEIFFYEGDTVNAGDVLVVIE